MCSISCIHDSPSSQRGLPSFQHRLLIRISTDEANQTLTITDLGSGMTRSDLINSLGVGSRLSSHALHAARAIDKKIAHANSNANSNANAGGNNAMLVNEDNTTMALNGKNSNNNDNDNSDDDDDDSEYTDNDNENDNDNDSVSTTSSEGESDDDDMTPTITAAKDIAGIDINHESSSAAASASKQQQQKSSSRTGTDKLQVPCQAKDIGSFYAALCALGLQVEIGTKVRRGEMID